MLAPSPVTMNAPSDRKRLLVIYDHRWFDVKMVADSLEAFERYSNLAVSYVSPFARCRLDLDFFDAIAIHHTIKVGLPGGLHPSYRRSLRHARCLKALFLQDEYDYTDANRAAIRDLGIRLVFTTVPAESLAHVYAPAEFPGVMFVQVLTGYVPLNLGNIAVRPMRERATLIGYRGRDMGYRYGDLSREKVIIGQRMRAICAQRGLATDIEWAEDKRIYGDAWLRFLAGCKATLGTESGANVFDFDGSLTRAIRDELDRNPNVSYDDIHVRYLRSRDGAITMNQISPKVFEAIACRTALVLFEGRYSGVLEPDRHYIPLRKDFSNVDEVLQRLHDDSGLEAMTERAYGDVLGAERYSYKGLVGVAENALRTQWASGAFPVREALRWLPLPACDMLPGFRAEYAHLFEGPRLQRTWRALPEWVQTVLRPLVSRDRWKARWLRLPGLVRVMLRPLLEASRSGFAKARWFLQ